MATQDNTTMINTMAQAISQANQDRACWVARVGKMYIGCNYRLVKTQRAALRMVTDDLADWIKPAPYWVTKNMIELVQVRKAKA